MDQEGTSLENVGGSMQLNHQNSSEKAIPASVSSMLITLLLINRLFKNVFQFVNAIMHLINNNYARGRHS